MGEYPVTHYRLIARCAALAAVAAALALTGCGRKGPLDPPPSAYGEPVPQQTKSPGRPDPGITPEGQAIAPRGQRKPVPPLDWLID